MEDKVFELLEKMYVEFSEFRKETREELKELKKDIIRIENEHGKKFDALFDGYKQLAEGQKEHGRCLDRIETKLDNLSLTVISHESKLEILEGGRKKKSLSP